MERDSFIFYKSFYEAIIGLPKDIRLEVLTAIVEYALYGKLPENLKPFAKGMFTLIKPNIDVNTARFENGKKGGRKKRANISEPNSAPPPRQSLYSLSFDQEIDLMKNDKELRRSVCTQFSIDDAEYDSRLQLFLRHCIDEKSRKGKERHNSIIDAHSHFRFWIAKAYPSTTQSQTSRNNDPAEIYSNGNAGYTARQQEFAQHIDARLSGAYDDEPDVSGNY